LLCSSFSIFCSAIVAQSQEKKSAKTRIDDATVVAYEKLGAEYGGWVKSGLARFFQAGRDSAEKGVRGFRFRNFSKGKLPEVMVPFGLDLSGSKVNQSGLKELTTLKNLVVLDLRNTQVTDAALKELAGLENLTSLNLCHAKVTDVCLKDVATSRTSPRST
jgi:hypothetical protein